MYIQCGLSGDRSSCLSRDQTERSFISTFGSIIAEVGNDSWKMLYWILKLLPRNNTHRFPSYVTGVSYMAMPHFIEAGKCSCTMFLKDWEVEKKLNRPNDSHNLACYFWLDLRVSLLSPFHLHRSSLFILIGIFMTYKLPNHLCHSYDIAHCLILSSFLYRHTSGMCCSQCHLSFPLPH